VDQIENVKSELDAQITDLVAAINGWAGIDDWSGLGAAATEPADYSSTPNKDSSAPGNMMSYHLQNNSGDITQNDPSAPPDPSQSAINTLMDALQQESSVLDAAFDQLNALASEYTSMDLEAILTKLMAILADSVLESAQVVMDAFLDVLASVSSTVIEILDTDIYIPVLSDILESFGVPSTSFLDLFCWVAAVPVTISYKLAEGTAPFADDSTTDFLTTASWAELEEAFLGSTTLSRGVGDTTISDTTKSAVFVSGHAGAGFFTLMSCFVSTFEAESEIGDNPFSIPSAIVGTLSAVSAGAATTLVPKDPIQNSAVSWVNTATSSTVVLCKMLFSGTAQDKFAASSGVMENLVAADGRATGSMVGSILTLPAFACTCWHFYELSQESASNTRSAAIINETANITSYISRISYAVAVNDPDPDSKQVPVAIMTVANVATAGLQTAEAFVGA
jgi:hypothetical protein